MEPKVFYLLEDPCEDLEPCGERLFYTERVFETPGEAEYWKKQFEKHGIVKTKYRIVKFVEEIGA